MQKILKNKKILIPSSVIILLLIAYLLLCMFVSSQDFLVNTRINGIEVGDMTKEEAIQALQTQFQNDQVSLNLTLLANDQKYQIDVKDNVVFDTSLVNDISDQISHSFFTKGYRYLFQKDEIIPVNIKDEEKLTQSIQKSKILDYDTKQKTQYQIKENSVEFTKGHDGEKTDLEKYKSLLSDAQKNNDMLKVAYFTRLIQQEQQKNEE